MNVRKHLRKIATLMMLAGVTFACLQNAVADAHAAKAVEVTILSSNLANGSALGEWGFSALAEVDGQCVLFDTGYHADTVLRNIEVLDVDLTCVTDIGVQNLMAGHCTGVEPMFRLRQQLKLDRGTAVIGAVGSRFVLGEGIYPTDIAK